MKKITIATKTLTLCLGATLEGATKQNFLIQATGTNEDMLDLNDDLKKVVRKYEKKIIKPTVEKRELHEVFKGLDGLWKVQAPKGVVSFTTKKRADRYAKEIKSIYNKSFELLRKENGLWHVKTPLGEVSFVTKGQAKSYIRAAKL